jgi:Tol biopolymer transport system component
MPAAWTANGAEIIFTSNRRGNSDVFRYDVKTESVTPLVTGPNEDVARALTPDGRWVLYTTRAEHEVVDSNTPWALMRVPVDGGTSQSLGPVPTRSELRCGSRPGSRCLLVEPIDNRLMFFELDPESGKQGKKLVELDPSPHEWWDFAWDLAPDGRWIAWIEPKENAPARLVLIDLDTKARREVELRSDETIGDIVWGQQGDFIYATGGGEGPLRRRWTKLLRLALDGSVVEIPSDAGDLGLGAPIPSPDGHSFVFSLLSSESAVWLLTNY